METHIAAAFGRAERPVGFAAKPLDEHTSAVRTRVENDIERAGVLVHDRDDVDWLIAIAWTCIARKKGARLAPLKVAARKLLLRLRDSARLWRGDDVALVVGLVGFCVERSAAE